MSTHGAPARPSWRDGGVALAAFALSLLFYSPGGAGTDTAAHLTASVLLSAAQSGVLVWRRRRPGLVTTAVLGVALVHAVVLGPVTPWPAWFALYALGRYVVPVRRAVEATGAALAGAAAVFTAGPAVHGVAADSLLLTLVVTLVAVLLAALVRTEQARLEALRQRAASLERERDAAAREATVGERLRIARDLHDLVGHGLSSMAVQSSSARMLLDRGEVEAARQRMTAVESTSRSAMREMRQLLDVLRDEQDTGRTPSPTALDVGDLVAAARRGGLEVTLTHDGPLEEVPAGVGLAAYRLVQESLTNVMKHAPGARVDVVLDARRHELLLEVRDRAAGDRPPVPAAGGHGLTGMRERVTGLGGALDVGPTGDGWRVAARLPVERTT